VVSLGAREKEKERERESLSHVNICTRVCICTLSRPLYVKIHTVVSKYIYARARHYRVYFYVVVDTPVCIFTYMYFLYARHYCAR